LLYYAINLLVVAENDSVELLKTDYYIC